MHRCEDKGPPAGVVFGGIMTLILLLIAVSTLILGFNASNGKT